MDCTQAQQLRHAYLDGEIDPSETPALEAHLRGCAECARLFRSERELSAAIKLEVPRVKAPDLLRARISRELARREGRRRRFGELRLLGVGWNPAAIAASLMLAMVASSAVTHSVLSGAQEDRMAQEVVASHIRSLMADHLTDVKSTDQHTVKPWFNGKLDLSPPVVDLAASGFPLIGGRLDYLDRHPVAALVYRHQQHVINVLVSPEDKSDAAPSMLAQHGYNVLRFARGGMNFWVVSDLNPAELRDFAAKLKEATPDRIGPS
jgi:anti-sigma factor (TIGR02949 family)